MDRTGAIAPSDRALGSGQIQLVMGPMFSGKTTEIMRRLKRFMVAQHKCLLIKYSKDNRYSADCASTHDNQKLRADVSEAVLADVSPTALLDVDVIAIDEGQFFPDLAEFSEAQANRGRIVIISALDGTFERKAFAPVLALIPLCEQVVKLSAVCMVCHKEAAFTTRLGSETKVEVIGGSDKYLATCRKCFGRPVADPPLDRESAPQSAERTESVDGASTSPRGRNDAGDGATESASVRSAPPSLESRATSDAAVLRRK